MELSTPASTLYGKWCDSMTDLRDQTGQDASGESGHERERDSFLAEIGQEQADGDADVDTDADETGAESAAEPDLPELTEEGRNRIEAICADYRQHQDLYRLEDQVEDILDATTRFGKGYMFKFPRTVRGVTLVTGGDADAFVLKICWRCLKGEEHPAVHERCNDCSNEAEKWVWSEAVRRGNQNFFAPILNAEDPRWNGWLVMSHGEYLGDLPYAESYVKKGDGLTTKTIKHRFKAALRARGWTIYDIECRAIGTHPVAIDYERAYPSDLFDSHYLHSFRNFYEHSLYPKPLIKEMNERANDLYPFTPGKRTVWEPNRSAEKDTEPASTDDSDTRTRERTARKRKRELERRLENISKSPNDRR